jgi:hypothetical protein
MKRVIFILLLSIANNLSAQMSCKDSVFNLAYTENMCLFNVWGEWKLDSCSTFSNQTPQPCSRKETWKFSSSSILSHTIVTGTTSANNTAKYKFIKGYLQLDEYKYSGATVASTLSYKVISIAPSRIILMDMMGNNPILFLYKVK